MATLPNFASLPFRAPSAAPAKPEAREWLTPEGLTVKSFYDSADFAGLDSVAT